MSKTDLAVPQEMSLSSGSVQALLPANMGEALQLATAVHESGLAPNSLKSPQAVLVAMLRGMEAGLPPLAALSHIAVIQGKPSLDGDAMLALVEQSGQLDAMKEHGNDKSATCWARRRGGREREFTFTIEDAKRAGLAGDNWKRYPQRMLRYRALGFVMRDLFPDVLLGMSAAEAEGEPDTFPTDARIDTTTGEVFTPDQPLEDDPVRLEEPTRPLIEPGRAERKRIVEVLAELCPGDPGSESVKEAKNDLLIGAANSIGIETDDAPYREDGFFDLKNILPEWLEGMRVYLEGVRDDLDADPLNEPAEALPL